MRLLGSKIVVFLLILVAGLPVAAQEQEGLSVGQMKLLLTAGLTYGNDDNVTFVQGGDEISSDFTMFSPGIRLEAPTDKSLFTLSFEGEMGRYSDSPIDDFDDWGLLGSWDYDPTSRTSVGAFAELLDGHDRRGEGRSQGDSGLEEFSPDEFELLSYGGYFDYGALGSRGRVELEARFTEREYTNNRLQTQFLDRDEDHFGATFFMRVRPKTSVLIGAEFTDINYLEDTTGLGSIDSEETRFFVGVTWDVSARTTGRIDIGKLEKDFIDPIRTDYDDDFYRVNVSWRPRTYSTFNLTATKSTNEANYFGEYVLDEDISLDWNHYWSTRFHTIVEYGVGDALFAPDIRNDEIKYWGIEGRWQINQHFQLGVGFQDHDRDSDDPEFDYERGLWMITLEGSL